MDTNLVLGSLAVVASLGTLWWGLSGPRLARVPIDLGGAHRRTPPDLRTATLQRGAGERAVEPMIDRLAEVVRRYTPTGRVAALERRLLLAGTPAGWTLERVLAAKVLLAGSGAVLGVLRFAAAPSALALILTIVLVVAGFYAPDLALYNKAQKRQELIKRSLADAIDQLTVAVQAGLGLDAAIARVGATTKGPLGAELSRVVQDVRAGMGRGDALTAMAERIQLAELRHVVLALAQAEKLGVPVAKTLLVQSSELRVKRRQHAEEQAMKLPVKILFPTVLCILPTLFIVVLGPAAISIYDSIVRG
jgi:tight adherence protein C